MRVRTIGAMVRDWYHIACYCEGVGLYDFEANHRKRLMIGAAQQLRRGVPPRRVIEWIFTRVERESRSGAANWERYVAKPKRH